ncbi:MAG: pilus assembly protein PilM [Acidimicrobiia bacterium]
MSSGVVGIELTSDRIRAVEVSGRSRRPQVLRVGEIEVPDRAVVDGEVVDVEIVGKALRELWAKSRFGTKRVALGLANRWVAIRTSEMPTMAIDDMRNALGFELGELIPFPLEDAIVDLAVVDEVALSTGGSRSRLLVVAVRRAMAEAAIRACTLARLDVVAIDPASLGVVRSVYLDSEMDHLAGTVLIGDLGPDGSAHVVVATDGRPVLGRTLNYAVQEAAPTGELEAELALIEQYRRRAASETGAGFGLSDRPMRQRSDPLLDALRSSFDYFQTQPGAPRVDRVVLLGANERITRLAPDLSTILSLSVEPLALLADRPVRKTEGVTLDRHGAALGVALRAAKMPVGYPLDLLPERMVRRRESRRLVVTAVAAAALSAGALGAYTMSRTPAGDNTAEQLDSVNGEVQQVQRQLSQYGQALTRQNQLNALTSVQASIIGAEIDWPALLSKVLAAAPSDTSLRSASVSSAGATPPAAPAATATPTPAAPNSASAAATPAVTKSTPRTAGANEIAELRFVVNGRGLASVGAWLKALAEVPGLQGAWLESSTTDPSGNTDFVVTVGVTEAARTARAVAVTASPSTQSAVAVPGQGARATVKGS